MNDILDDTIDCNFEKLKPLTDYLATTEFGPYFLRGTNPISARKCEVKGIKFCCQPTEMRNDCLRFKVHILKFVRYPLTFLPERIFERDDVTVLYLYRDPRSVMASRKSHFNIWCRGYCQNDTHLCHTMLEDHKRAAELQILYPDKFKMVAFESLLRLTDRKEAELKEFIGDVDNTASIGIFKLSSKKDDNWINRLSYEQVTGIQEHCRDLLTHLNYSLVMSPEDLELLKKSRTGQRGHLNA